MKVVTRCLVGLFLWTATVLLALRVEGPLSGALRLYLALASIVLCLLILWKLQRRNEA